uniref:Uncharacterized protein n=1 Tax=Ralstonia syzygii R24 TaxID=907261 RepID=G3ACC4_9RALS|nr:hypothetical protein RALSY_mp30534 [Ralstonia syzygii R24]
MSAQPYLTIRAGCALIRIPATTHQSITIN